MVLYRYVHIDFYINSILGIYYCLYIAFEHILRGIYRNSDRGRYVGEIARSPYMFREAYTADMH
jgi:hypothetical protein